jgi:phage-related protein
LGRFPDEILAQAKEAFRFLESGVMLTMLLSRPMPSIWRNAHELRILGRGGQYRIIYVLLGGGDIFIPHCFQKKKESTPLKDLNVAKSRTKEFIHATHHREF